MIIMTLTEEQARDLAELLEQRAKLDDLSTGVALDGPGRGHFARELSRTEMGLDQRGRLARLQTLLEAARHEAWR